MNAPRKLAAILAADVAGYSRLMGLDEAGTAKALREHRAAIDPVVAGHGGRIVKTTGDGVLLEFPSIVAAIECAVAVQKLMAERNADVPADRRMLFRIGINLGDVLIEGEDILGDGVNVAARLEGISEPGGICISEAAYQQVCDKLDVNFEDTGEQRLKNIARPVRVFRIALGDAQPAKPIWSWRSAVAVRRDRWSARVAAIGAAVALIAGAGGAALYFYLDRAPVVPQTPSQLAKPPERFSIVVLPFANLSGDSSQNYLADVISDELTTRLSLLPASFVISRSTAFTYKGKPPDVRQIGKDLGVRYVLEGSVQPSGDRLRVNAQLIDTESDAHLWADQFDENRSDLLQMQDDIVGRIGRAMHLKMPAELSRLAQTRAANPNAEDLAWRCRAAFMRTYGTLESDAAFRLCEQALQIDPENVRALATLSFKFSRRFFTLTGPDRQADLRRADELASLAITIDPNFYNSYHAKGDVLMAQGRYQEAIDSFRRATSLNPSAISFGLPSVYNLLGEPEQAIAYADKAMRRSPNDPFSVGLYAAKAQAYGILQDYQEALVWARRAEAAGPDNPNIKLTRSALLALTGQEADARATMQRYLASPNAPIRTITQYQRVQLPTDSPRFLTYRQKLNEGLRKAGLPE